MIPKTSDGRVMFGVPWHNRVILGTTDIPVKEFVLEPKALEEEIGFILETAGHYLDIKPQKKDVLCVFAGLRPLAAPGNDSDSTRTKEISRSHKLIVSASGLVTITGGKWTTYRIMAEDTIDKALRISGLPFKSCTTRNLKIHGYDENSDKGRWTDIYGSDRDEILSLEEENPAYRKKLHEDFEFTIGQVIWAVRKEMARTIEDVLARRIRVLFLDAKASVAMAPLVAEIMADELNKDKGWEERQVHEYTEMAKNYIL
jgi:glycerol-3-phosphate dehydrogenase